MGYSVAFYLATKEIWRARGRFMAIGSIIALITLLVLFLAGLGEGLGNGNREYLGKLNGELILFQEQANLSVSASQFGRSVMNDVLRASGVADAGAIGFSSVFVSIAGGSDLLSVSMMGVEPGRPGEPPAFEGRGLSGLRVNEVVIDENAAVRLGLSLGDEVIVKSTQGTVDELFSLRVVGISDGRQYFIQPSIFVPLVTWDRIRPKAVADNGQSELTFNIIAVKLADPGDEVDMAQRLEERLGGVEAVNRRTAYEAAPGYSAQQSTINTQQGFTLLIGMLVVGGFFQIQTLQKVAQVGMLKALGASNGVVSLAALFQIIVTNFLGVFVGSLATLGLAASFPPGIPIVFQGNQVLIALVTLFVIGPLGGLLSLRILAKVEPLTALGLAS
jgi:putative ABC transport system permease protein